MPKSLSDDMGKTWTYSAGPFPPIGGGQRPVLMRLQEGPLLFASFAEELTIRDASGEERTVHGRPAPPERAVASGSESGDGERPVESSVSRWSGPLSCSYLSTS